VPDAARQLAELHLAGFEIQTFERYPRAVGVLRDGAIALVEPTAEGLKLLGVPGWRMGEVMGVLVEQEGRKVFQAKQEVVEASPEKLAAVQRLGTDLAAVLGGSSRDE
jgi:hypothetical protein